MNNKITIPPLTELRPQALDDTQEHVRAVNSEEHPAYLDAFDRSLSTSTQGDDDHIIKRAMAILAGRLSKPEAYVTQPDDARKLAVLKLAERQNEAFCVLWLDNRHGVLEFREMFQGTIDGASVHPRVVVQRALQVNAAACILVHNHPSGALEPSQADQRITQRLRDALALVEVRVLDHLIVGGTEVCSFAERGLL